MTEPKNQICCLTGPPFFVLFAVFLSIQAFIYDQWIPSQCFVKSLTINDNAELNYEWDVHYLNSIQKVYLDSTISVKYTPKEALENPYLVNGTYQCFFDTLTFAVCWARPGLELIIFFGIFAGIGLVWMIAALPTLYACCTQKTRKGHMKIIE